MTPAVDRWAAADADAARAQITAMLWLGGAPRREVGRAVRVTRYQIERAAERAAEIAAQ